eukprot:TRINITY_DN19729_c0_g1_i2.p1 TRINITY_DN19729_c0_g1~~TRINITY_DN19729_c0_g1_i2.p1  ORF type:complete len:959 (-),score=131.82 TRINITY_DN19729_c0_g1_i2:28-2904(-)
MGRERPSSSASLVAALTRRRVFREQVGPLAGLIVCASALICSNAANVSDDNPVFTIGAFVRPSAEVVKRLTHRSHLVSDPRSEHYGAYLSQDDLIAAVDIDAAVRAEISGWLQKAVAAVRAALRAQNTSVRLNKNSSHGDAGDKDASDAALEHAAARYGEVAHGDVVTAELNDWTLSYLLGVGITGGRLPGVNSSFPPGPPSMELLVTPSMPDHHCKRLTSGGKLKCQANLPCRWHECDVGSKAHGHCKTGCVGVHYGWVCWFEDDVWRCAEPVDIGNVSEGIGGKPTLERVAMTERDGDEDLSQWRQLRRRGRLLSALAQKTKNTTIRVFPANQGLQILVITPKNATALEWHSVELSFRQEGRDFMRILSRRSFKQIGSRFMQANVEGLANLRPVDDIVACFHFRDDSRVVGGSVSAADANLVTASGRNCERLGGLSPFNESVDFVLPTSAQTLSTLRHSMGIPGLATAKRTTADAGTQSTQAVAEFSYQNFLQEDVDEMLSAYGLSKAANISVEGPGGTTNRSAVTMSSAGEGSLDLQAISSLSPGALTSWWGVAPYDMDGFILRWATLANDHHSPPLVHSISWGAAEGAFPPAYVRRVDYELMKLVLRGVSILIASGDNGIASVGVKCGFISDLVGSSPWVTTVGATMQSLEAAPFCRLPHFREVLGTCTEAGPVTCSATSGAIITSSGYWSLYRERPAYQDVAVTGYMDEASQCAPCRGEGSNAGETPPTAPCFFIDKHNGCHLRSLLRSKRAAPDVAAPGHSFPTLVDGHLGLFDGTSASAPALAALVSLLNAEQLRHGRPPLGFLNPWLYQTHAVRPDAFVDVVVGNISSTEKYVCPWGFRAAPGWDPATGLGVPQYNVLKELLPKPTARNASHLAQASITSTSSLNAVVYVAAAATVVISFVSVCFLAASLSVTRRMIHGITQMFSLRLSEAYGSRPSRNSGSWTSPLLTG